MLLLNKKEREELIELAKSDTFRNDLRILAKNRFNPFYYDGQINVDRYITFLTEYNSFTNHIGKPFYKIKGDCFRL